MGLARIRKGDTVIVISGKDRNKTGRVIAVDPERERVLVEGVNVMKRHAKPTPKNREGGIIEGERSIHLSKVMPLDPETSKGTRVRIQRDADGSKTRVAKSGKAIKHEAI